MFKQKIALMGFLSIFLLVSILTIITFNIIVLEDKFNQQVLQLDETSELITANENVQNSQKLIAFKESEHASAVWALVNRGGDMNVYIKHLNNHIAAINSLNMAKKLLAQEESSDLSAVHLAATVITEHLENLRSHALKHPALLSSYEDRYLKEAVFLLEHISTSEQTSKERQKVLSDSYLRLLDQGQAIADKMILELTSEKQTMHIILFGAIAIGLLILLLQLKTTWSLMRGSSDISEKVLFIRHYLRENNGSDHNNYADDTPLESLFNEAKISVGVLSKKNQQIEDLHKKMQNSNSLATLLGYEINALTSIVAGGLSLNKKESSEESTFDQEIYGALGSLENLSDNFNHLFTTETLKIDLDKEFNVHEQLNKMLVLINSKCRGLNKEFDFVIDDSVPLFIGGDAYRFYWCLYNILVRCIDGEEKGKCILHVSAQEGTSIENKLLQIKLISTDNTPTSYSALLEDVTSDASSNISNINAQLYERIINTFFTGDVNFKETELGNSNIEINLLITPKSHGVKLQKVTANVLVCAEPGVQTSIAVHKLTQAGAEVVLCDSDDELMKKVSKDAKFDFVIISDYFLKNKALVKVVATKTNGKIILLSNLNNTAKVASKSVGDVLNIPLYQSKLLATLSDKNAVEEAEAKVLSVLVVDDDPSQQFILSHFLKRVGIVPELANDCDTALKMVKKNDYDLVFMDCIMPGKDGFETTDLIREYEASLKHDGKLEKPLTIIGNTSLTAASEIDKCIQAGMDAVLNKPYKNDKILELLTRYS